MHSGLYKHPCSVCIQQRRLLLYPCVWRQDIARGLFVRAYSNGSLQLCGDLFHKDGTAGHQDLWWGVSLHSQHPGSGSWGVEFAWPAPWLRGRRTAVQHSRMCSCEGQGWAWYSLWRPGVLHALCLRTTYYGVVVESMYLARVP